MPGQLLPRPAVAAARVREHQFLGEEPVEEIEVITGVGVPVEMAVFWPGLLHLQISHDRRLAGVDADGVEPAGDPLVVADRHLAWGRDEGDAVAALALDGKDALADAGPARLIDLLGEVTAGVDAGDGDLQAAAVFELEQYRRIYAR